jgi:hypothetical protein
VTFSVSVAGISGVEINEPYRAGGMSDGPMAVESVELRIPRSGNKTCKVGARDAEALPGRGFGECLGAVDRRYLNGATRSAAVDGFSSDG